MIKVYQTKYGLEGNCFAACIASLFDVGINEIPFLSDYQDDWDEYLKALNLVLRNKFGVVLVYGELNDWEDYLNV